MSETARTEGVFWVDAGDLRLADTGGELVSFRIGLGNARDGGRCGTAKGLPLSLGGGELERSGATIIQNALGD